MNAAPELITQRSEVNAPGASVDARSATPSCANSVKERGSNAALRSALPTAPMVALLTGGGDKPYALGIAEALTTAGLTIDFIGSDDLEVPVITDNQKITFLNLRGDQQSNAGWLTKATRVLKYYLRLISYAATARPSVFHILWNNKFELFDRTVLMLYYKVLGKRIVLTAHNVNAKQRDLTDSWLNRKSLKFQYRLCDHVFVHTAAMKRELVADYGIGEEKVTVIPFGINNTVPVSDLSTASAREKLGLSSEHKTILFFGNIAPYKGLEYLVDAFIRLSKHDDSYRLIIVGKPKGQEAYWASIKETIDRSGFSGRTIQVIDYVPDKATELYFKAADVLVLPYTRVFQSGVLFLSYSFGLPVVAADVASLKEEIIEGRTGFVFQPGNSVELAKKLDIFFKSDLFQNLEAGRRAIRCYANEHYAWEEVAVKTSQVYSGLLSSRI